VLAGSARLAVVGAGLNVQPQPTDELSSGYACLQELDPAATAPAALAQVAAPLVKALIEFDRHGFAPFAERYAARDFLRGQAVTTTQASVPSGVAEGVSGKGALLVRAGDGLHEVASGEVSVRLNPGGAA